MDKKDMKILGALLLNSRASITSIAKKTGVSREVAIYRINNLNKEVIRGYYASININALGFKRFGCGMQFKNISPEKEENLIKEIADHPLVNYLGPIIGKWNLAFDIIAKDDAQLKQVLDHITSKAKGFIDAYLITSPGEDFGYFPLKYIGEKESHKPKTKTKPASYDDIDMKLLSILAKNSRADYVQLSKMTKLSPNAIKYRIKNMEKTGLIQGYTISIDYTKLGLQFFNIQLKMNISDDKRFISYIKDHPNIIYYYKYIGQENWDMDVGVISKNAEDFRKVIIDIKKEFGEILKIHDIYMIPHMIKDNVAPEGIFD